MSDVARRKSAELKHFKKFPDLAKKHDMKWHLNMTPADTEERRVTRQGFNRAVMYDVAKILLCKVHDDELQATFDAIKKSWGLMYIHQGWHIDQWCQLWSHGVLHFTDANKFVLEWGPKWKKHSEKQHENNLKRKSSKSKKFLNIDEVEDADF